MTLTQTKLASFSQVQMTWCKPWFENVYILNLVMSFLYLSHGASSTIIYKFVGVYS